MKRFFFLLLAQCLTAGFLFAQTKPLPSGIAKAVSPDAAIQSDATGKAKILDRYGDLPLSFEANQGQADGAVKFLSRTSQYALFLTGDEAVFAFAGTGAPADTEKASTVSSVAAPKAGDTLRMKLVGSTPAARVTGVDKLPGSSNYFVGKDPAKWRTNVANYARVKYQAVYPGIDLVYYGNHRQLEYDFVVAPGADPKRIGFEIRGAKRIRRDAQGDLIFKMDGQEVRWQRPVVYQEKRGARVGVGASYVVAAKDRVSFRLSGYDSSLPLYIDPLLYSTFLGGGAADYGSSIALDSAGNAYVTGYTYSSNFPTTSGAFQSTCNICLGDFGDAFLTKLNPAGTSVVYSTYLGGSLGATALGVAIDQTGSAYVTGYTASTDFPVTAGAFQTTCYVTYSYCNSAFVTKINPAGSALVYSTYLSGSGGSSANGIALNSSGNAFVTGLAGNNFPVTPDAFQTTCGSSCSTLADGSAFVTALNSTGNALLYSTYVGGLDTGAAIAVDQTGDAYIAGTVGSSSLPVTPGAFQVNYAGGGADGFVTKLNSSGSALVYSTYIGGASLDYGQTIAVDASGNAYLGGETFSDAFPTTPGAFQTTFGGVTSKAFLTKLNPAGSALIYSSFVGGSTGYNDIYGVAVDSEGNAYVTGYTQSTDFPLANATQDHFGGGNCDAFVTEMTAAGAALSYSSYLGGRDIDVGYGIALDSGGNAYVAGYTSSDNFPTVAGSFQTKCNLGKGCDKYTDAFVTKLYIPVDTGSPYGVAAPAAIDFGLVTVGQTSPTKIVALNNTGGSQMTVTSITVTGNFVLSNNSCNDGVKPNTHCNVYVAFSPTGLGAATGTLTFNDNGTNTPQTVSLSGTGTNAVATTTSLTSSPNGSGYGEAVVLLATVSSSNGAPPNGEAVTFEVGSDVLGNGTLSDGSASFTTTQLGVGTSNVKAIYGGDANFEGSTSSTVRQTVVKASTTTTLVSSLNPSAYAEPVTFTATVAPQFTGVPSGQVNFHNGSFTIKAGLEGGVATYVPNKLDAGTSVITADYLPDGNKDFTASSSNAISQVVSQASTTTTLISSVNPSNSGESVTFTATISGQFGGTISGNVTFMDGTSVLGTTDVSKGSAKYTTKKLTAGSHDITATYNGSTDFVGSSASLTQTVN